MNIENTWFEKFKRTAMAFLPISVNRSGKCGNCGECCKLPQKCPFLKERSNGKTYCSIYAVRPVNCRKYPRIEKEFITKETCGFNFEE
ncbi:YkgJ family cysteine cluster protein [Patescibacteria group bacterium]